MRAVFAAFALLMMVLPSWAAPSFPALTGRVVDDAHVLSAATTQDLTQKLAALEAKTSRQLVVVTIPSLGGYEISDYGYQLGRAWGIGQKGMNNGAILLVAPSEHKVRIEVGYGLEPVLTDALSSVIIQTQMLPAFRQGNYDAGVQAGAAAIIQQLSLDTSTAEQKAAAAEQQVQHTGNSGGGGIPGLLVFFIILFVIFRVFGGWGFLPFLFMGGGPGGFGGGGFGGGGGGFSGGGGSFGGGGSSGSW